MTTLRSLWHLAVYLGETFFQCFIILPVFFIWEKCMRDLQTLATKRRDEGEFDLIRMAAQVVLNFFDRDEDTLRFKKKVLFTHNLDESFHVVPESSSPPSFTSSPRGHWRIDTSDRHMAWANDLLQQSWSYIAKWGNERVQRHMDGLLAEKSISHVKRMKCEMVSLGSVAPVILEVKVLPKISTPALASGTNAGAIEMIHVQITFEWMSALQGLLSMSTHASTLMGSMQVNVQCSELCVAGVLNLVLGPLIPAIPHCKLFSAPSPLLLDP